MKTNYRITTNTLAIFPMHDLHCQSTILEINTCLTSTKKPLDIIKENCLHYFSTYHGRKASIQHHLGYQQKTPIPIHPAKGIYAYPTQSPAAFECIWLFLHAVTHIKKEQQHTKIHFINGKTIVLNSSYYTLQKQHDRARCCKTIFIHSL